MKKASYLSLVFLILSSSVFSQSFDDSFSRKKMKKDLDLFKKIRSEANSGLYKYRTKEQIDSIYHWADLEIEQSSTFGEFYNIICHLTDFEGSLHNDTSLPKKVRELMRAEESGYFPLPAKLIEGKLIVNIEEKEIPLGSEIVTINGESISSILPNLYKYYTTDGLNITGKSIGINYVFSRYYRMNYGSCDSFELTYNLPNSTVTQQTTIQSIGSSAYSSNVLSRYSKPYDEIDYTNSDELEEKYTFQVIDDETAILTINTFAIGWGEEDVEHIAYLHYLDSVFGGMKQKEIKNLIVDVRHNGGGSDPNDLVTYSYIADRNFSENKQAWISFYKIPYLKYIDSKFPAFLRPLGVGKYNREFQEIFTLEKNGNYYQDASSFDHKIRTPAENAFNGKVYLLISPRVASAGSLFAAMAAGNANTITIGEETMGGYYGHNGHTPLEYVLPKSKIGISFSVVNLEQDVPLKENQFHDRGIIPDYTVPQTFADYLLQKDTQMDFVMELIEEKK